MGRVKVTGLGITAAKARNKEELFNACLNKETAISDLGLASLSEAEWQSLRNSTPQHLQASHCTLLSFQSLSAALTECEWSESELRDAGFLFASTTSQIDNWEQVLPRFRRSPKDEHLQSAVTNQSLGTPLLSLTEHFGIQGPKALLASSCSASLQALALGLLWIQSGKVKRCIVGGTEINNELTRVGFQSLRLLSKSPCKPFDKNRAGINLGEGSAFLCLEESSLRTTKGFGFLRGCGLSTDAYHPTAPHPEGRGSLAAMKAALKMAGLSASDIPWVYAHGTGSPANDQTEAKAIEALYPHRPFVSSTKSVHGHTLGACGVIESVLGLMALQSNQLLPTVHFSDSDPLMTVNVAVHSEALEMKHFIKNSLGFGGINASVVFSKEPGPSVEATPARPS